jgi:hypothetical protein
VHHHHRREFARSVGWLEEVAINLSLSVAAEEGDVLYLHFLCDGGGGDCDDGCGNQVAHLVSFPIRINLTLSALTPRRAGLDNKYPR